MLTILIGILIFITLIVIAVKTNQKKTKAILSTISCTVLIFSVLLGLFIPIEGFEKECKLITKKNLINNDLFNEAYVVKDSSNAYFYSYKTSQKTKKDYVYGKVIIIQSKECKTPVLLEYERKPKRGIWTFALFVDCMEYVFYIPNETIIQKY